MTDNQTTKISQLEERILRRITPIMFEDHHGQYEAVTFEVSQLVRIAKALIDEIAIVKEVTGFNELDQAFLDGLKPHLAMKKKMAS